MHCHAKSRRQFWRKYNFEGTCLLYFVFNTFESSKFHHSLTFPEVFAKQEVEGKHCKLQVWQAFIAKQIKEKFSGVDNMLHFFIFHCISASQLNDNLWLDHFCRIKFLSAGKSLIGRQWRHMFFDLQGRAVNQVAINVKRVYIIIICSEQ